MQKIAEYKRKCNECGKTWHSLAQREQQISLSMLGNSCGGCSSCGDTRQAQYSRNLDANEDSLHQLKKCPECGSSNYTETIIYHEKQ